MSTNTGTVRPRLRDFYVCGNLLAVEGLDKHILYVQGIADLKVDVPVDTAVSHVVDYKAEGRLIQAFVAVHRDSKDIFLSCRLQVLGQIHGKGRVATGMGSQELPV